MPQDSRAADRTPEPPDPARVHILAELKQALGLLRACRSYADLDKAINPQHTPRGPRLLPPSTLSSLVNANDPSAPSRLTVERFLAACGLDERAGKPWLAAWERVTTADLRRPPGEVRVRDANPRQLGVHASIQVDPSGTGLPAYVARDLDLELRTQLTAACDQGGGMVLLVGGSSVGKTRALFEAVHAVLGEWWLIHPDHADPTVLADLAAAPTARTVVWLDELQRYLGPGGLTSGRARALMAAGAVLVATLWPNEYQSRVQQRPGQPDPPDRDLIDLAHAITVPDQLTAGERARAKALAAADARIRTALATPDIGMTQVLAAGPDLVRRWEAADNPYGKALLTAALDARRVGASAPLSARFLEAAAPAYLTGAEQAAAPPDWLDQALTYATTPVRRGAAAALTPVPAGMGSVAGYTAADYLHQHARRTRRTIPVPEPVWQALVDYHPHDYFVLGDNAHRRGQQDFVEHFYREAANAGHDDAAHGLANLLAEQGRTDEAIAVLRRHADGHDTSAAARLAKLLARHGRADEAILVLRPHADAGDRYASDRLAHLLAEHGRVDVLRQRADAGDGRAALKLADLLVEQGNIDEATAILRPHTGDGLAALRLAQLLARHGRIDEGIAVLRPHTDAGDGFAALWLANLLADQGRADEAITMLRQQVDAGSRYAASRLAEDLARLLAEHGRTDELRQRADAGDRSAANRLADLLVGDGHIDEAMTVLRLHTDTEFEVANQLASLLAEHGRTDELRQRADAGDQCAAQQLAQLLDRQGLIDEAIAVLRPHAGAYYTFEVVQLAWLLAEQGLINEAVTLLRPHADTNAGFGDGRAVIELADLLAEHGKIDEAIAVLRPHADAGDGYASGRLVKFLVKQGQIDQIEDEVHAGTTGAVERLAKLRSVGTAPRNRR